MKQTKIISALVFLGSACARNIYRDRDPSSVFYQFGSDLSSNIDSDKTSVAAPNPITGFRRSIYNDPAYRYVPPRSEKPSRRGNTVGFRETVIHIPANAIVDQPTVPPLAWNPDAVPVRGILRKAGAIPKAANTKKVTINEVTHVRLYNPREPTYLGTEKCFSNDVPSKQQGFRSTSELRSKRLHLFYQ